MFFTKTVQNLIMLSLQISTIRAQAGPDPWNYDISDIITNIDNENDVPPDIRISLDKNIVTANKETVGIGEWSFKRMLAIMLTGGKTQEDGNVVVSLQLKFDQNHWQTLNEYVKSGTPLTEDVFRRTLGYVENAVYKPSISEKIVMAWTDYIQIYISDYKMQITWAFSMLAALLGSNWLWNHMSHRHIFIIIFVMLYLYEVFISYKEAEEKEYQRFVKAVNSCKWYFWTSSCEIPPPDILTFLKHMNPMKIGIRMFTTVISEPMVVISAVVKTMINDITDGLWWPFDKIVYGILTVSINMLLILFLVTIIFNYLLNIPINLSFGLIGVALKERRTIFSSNDGNQTMDEPVRSRDNADKISSTTLDKILDVCSQALQVKNNVNQQKSELGAITPLNVRNTSAIKRSSSTGRLPDCPSVFENNNNVALTNNIRLRRNAAFEIGGGDAS